MSDTLLKWPGGKGREFALAHPAIPSFSQYVGPFFGGGAFFFQLRPRRAFVNDVNSSLIGLYRSAKLANPQFRETMSRYTALWEQLCLVAEALRPPLLSLYAQSRMHPRVLQDSVRSFLASYEREFAALFPDFFGDQTQLWTCIIASIQSKFIRLPKLERDNAIQFDAALMGDHVETAIRAGAYTYFRDDFTPRTEWEEIANFYFLREFCYGSMFRFNKNGKFNIPYGGIGYNRKDFTAKAARLFAPQTQQLFADTELYNLDFRAFFDAIRSKLTPDTFCFLDPPYDTEFSAYDNFAFTAQDQTALADLFAALPCQAMMIIKSTPFILHLYEQAQQKNTKIEIVDFEKTYTYNVRGRNARDVKHLMICNYPMAT